MTRELPPLEKLYAVADRFWAKVDRSGECWIWQAAQTGTGYGLFAVERRTYPAHRLSWALANGKQPPTNLHCCHNCPGGDNRACVNPAHLWLGTNAENTIDAYRKGHKSAQALLTHCKRGHPLSGSNAYINRKTGRRVCRQCDAACNRTRKLERRATKQRRLTECLHGHPYESDAKRDRKGRLQCRVCWRDSHARRAARRRAHATQSPACSEQGIVDFFMDRDRQ